MKAMEIQLLPIVNYQLKLFGQSDKNEITYLSYCHFNIVIFRLGNVFHSERTPNTSYNFHDIQTS